MIFITYTTSTKKGTYIENTVSDKNITDWLLDLNEWYKKKEDVMYHNIVVNNWKIITKEEAELFLHMENTLGYASCIRIKD